MPYVSVIIPTHNRKDFVQQAIDSVLTQTYRDYEIIVVDDGSEDGTGELLRARYGDAIRYLWQENQGPSVARNRGLAEANGKYIAFLDDDDVYFPAMLERTVGMLEMKRDVGHICVQGYQISECGEIVEKPARRRMEDGYVDAEELLFQRPALPSNSVFRVSVLSKIGGFDTDLEWGEDGDLFYRVVSATEVYYLAEALVAFRLSGDKRSAGLLDPDKNKWWYKQNRKGYAKLEENPHFKELLPRAWAVEKARYAMVEIANEPAAVHAVEDLLLEAFELESSDWFLEEVMRRQFLVFLEILDETKGAEEALLFAQTVFGAVNDTRAFRRQWKRLLLGEFYAKRFFKQAYQGDTRMRGSYIRAIAHDPAYLKNRGMHSFVLRSFLQT